MNDFYKAAESCFWIIIGGYMIYREINKIILNKSIKYGLEATREITTTSIGNKYSKERTSMGFFIRSNLLITNYHVIQPLLKSKVNESEIKISGETHTLSFSFDGTLPAIDLTERKLLEDTSPNLTERKLSEDTSSRIILEDINSIKIFYDKDNDLACIELRDQNNKFIESEGLFNYILKYIFDINIYKPSVFSIGPCKNNIKQISYGVVLNAKTINVDGINISTINSNIHTPYGFSGGPLLTYYGHLMGINFCATDPDFTISYAVDTNTIFNFLQRYDDYITEI